ncbi:MAG TPA: adenylate/guanylate cyclase domain-containing protein [Gaiellaceae bacterium]
MAVCASCGAENREEARFCDSCGATLAEAAPVRETRKTVTVLFCDVTGSTALGERIDPESLRHVMARYFETAKAIVERHGGTVEKFIGDAVMAVFGVPAVHEDDALRAVRAADELRGGLDELNDELEQSYGTRLELRMGMNTGEVVTGTEERLATGDAVNVAARLEQAAQPGEVLLGEETYGLVRDGIEAEPAPPLAAKGKAEPLTAYRLLSVQAEAPARRDAAPMVGRKRQRSLLENTFSAVTGERACHLVTVLGTAGVGKSRLVYEFLNGIEGATVVRGRCLSYGDGISYWPVTEVVKQLVPDESAIGPLASILGDDSAASSPDEIAWAFRKLLESRAAEQPIVVVFDDVHWGEPTFLDLVEHVADLSRDAPILMLCMARPELLDLRPTWGGGKLNAANVLLEPLGPDESAELIESLAGEIPDGLQARILEAAGGNPLFVEEMIAMVPDDGGDVAVPPTIQALLAARLDQLDPAERDVLERGAVEGQVFHRGAVTALDPENAQVDGRLITLVRKDLVRPEPTVVPDDDAYRFRHLLIRDTAYEALPKATRAELHERFAIWLAEFGADLVELDEIVGYHLEQAYGYRAELGPVDDQVTEIGARAADRLIASANRARERGDTMAAQSLFARAVELLPAASAVRAAATLELAVILGELGEFVRASELRNEAAATAGALQDERILARVKLAKAEVQIQDDPSATMRGSLALAEEALAELERLGDEEGAVWALRLVGNFRGWLGSGAEAEFYWQQALERAELFSPRLVSDVLIWRCWDIWWGGTPAEEGIRLCDEFMQRSASKRVEAIALLVRGTQKAALRRIDEGRVDVAAGRALLKDFGDLIWWAGSSMIHGEMELMAGKAETAYEALAEGQEYLAASFESGYLATVIGFRAQAALELGREDEALQLADETGRVAAQDDFEPHARRRCVRARTLARRGEFEAADELLGEAAEIIEVTDYVMLHLDLAFARADVDRLAGRPEAEREVLERALPVAEAKQNLVAVDRIRTRLAETS